MPRLGYIHLCLCKVLRLCDVLRRDLFRSFGRSGSLPDSNVIISYYRNFGSVSWIARSYGTPENQISHSWVRVSCRDERNLKTHRSLRSPKREGHPVSKKSFRSFITLSVGTRKPLVDLVTLRAVYLVVQNKCLIDRITNDVHNEWLYSETFKFKNFWSLILLVFALHWRPMISGSYRLNADVILAVEENRSRVLVQRQHVLLGSRRRTAATEAATAAVFAARRA